MSRVKRIHKELEDVKKDKEANITLELVSEDDLSHLKGTFIGPRDTPYEGGLFTIDIKVPPEYPFKPPIMKFDTKIYHPNISSVTGAICLDILKSDSSGHGAWTPILTLKSSLISLQSLLQSPEPNDPQDLQVANVYLKDKKQFDETAKTWTKIYAPNTRPGAAAVEDSDSASKRQKTSELDDGVDLTGIDPHTVTLFQDMGFDRSKIVLALRKLKLMSVSLDNDETKTKVIEELLK